MAILKTDAIQWYEGMLLQPHHFQQNDLRLRELLNFNVSQVSPFHWGIKDYDIDSSKLVSGQLQFLHLEAIMPDGLVVSLHETEEEILFADLTKYEKKLSKGPVMTYLAVPRYIYGGANAIGKNPRFSSSNGIVVVDENTGDNETTIPSMTPNLTIFIDEKPGSSYIYFPLFEIKLDDNTYKMTSFSPPLLKVKPGSELGKFSQSVTEGIRSKISYLVDRLGSNSKFVAVRNLEESIKALSAGLLPFEARLNSGVSHPFELYISLCTLAGNISGLNPQQIPPVFKAYKHNDIQESFKSVRIFVDDLLNRIQENYYTAKLSNLDGKFEIDIDDEFMGQKYLVLGAKVSSGLDTADLVKWIEDSIISTDTSIEAAIENRILGAKREVIQTEDSLNLSTAKGTVLFRIYIDDRFIISGEKLSIINNLEKKSSNPLGMVLYVPKN